MINVLPLNLIVPKTGAVPAVTVRFTFVDSVKFPSWALIVRVYWPGATELEAMIVMSDAPVPEIGLKLKAALVPDGRPDTLKVTVSLNPFIAVTFAVNEV